MWNIIYSYTVFMRSDSIIEFIDVRVHPLPIIYYLQK